MPDTSPAGFDPEALDRLRRFGGGKLLLGMIELFIANAPERLAAARQALAANDANGVRQALHALKSSAGQLGAVALQELCAQGEAHASRGELAPVHAIAPALEQEFQAARQRLEAERTGG
ncbi:MAG TPA: Hpt domain-containing protein [Gemmatimonadaceae bacterium]|jgi:HPt (histidine-containing phosphotransfer) domain-containing protein|nr:Hpt domain-containing protein [Gemmatimonadaceae bacterium]